MKPSLVVRVAKHTLGQVLARALRFIMKPPVQLIILVDSYAGFAADLRRYTINKNPHWQHELRVVYEDMQHA